MNTSIIGRAMAKGLLTLTDAEYPGIFGARRRAD